jgi:hypothetical protein
MATTILAKWRLDLLLPVPQLHEHHRLDNLMPLEEGGCVEAHGHFFCAAAPPHVFAKPQ